MNKFQKKLCLVPSTQEQCAGTNSLLYYFFFYKDILKVLSVHLYCRGVILHNNVYESYMDNILLHPLISIHLVPDPLETRNMIDYQTIYYKHLKCYLETI